MSFMAKQSAQMENQLKVQELNVTSLDTDLFIDRGANTQITVGEPLDRAISAVQIVAAGTVTAVPFANISIVDSAAGTAGGDRKALLLTGISGIAAGDVVTVKYVVSE